MASLLTKDTRVINVHGAKGIGKTRMVLETVKYLWERCYYMAGMRMLDLKDVTDLWAACSKLEQV